MKLSPVEKREKTSKPTGGLSCIRSMSDEALESALSDVLSGSRTGDSQADASAVVSEVVLRWRSGVRRSLYPGGQN